MFKKNTAVIGFQIGHFIQIADGIAKTTGIPVGKRLLDNVAGTLSNIATYDASAGVWKIDLTAADMNADVIGLSFTLDDCLPISYTIHTNALNWTTLGPGAITFTYTLTSSVDDEPIADADVWVSTDIAGSNVIAVGRTNATGQVVFYLDAGTVYVWRQKSGWTFVNPDTEVVA